MPASPCPACGRRDSYRWRPAHPVIHGQAAAEALPLHRCRSCGSAWLPDPEAEAEAALELYESGTYAGPGAVERSPGPIRRLLDRDRLRLLGPLPEGARVIEVGAGRGRMVAALRRRGYDAVGIEPSASARADAEGRGIALESASVEAASFPEATADAVVFWHVLEHVSRPPEALCRARQWLRPHGRLVVAVPNLSSLQARIGGDRWFHQDVPRHLFHFTVGGLKRLLARSGFTPVRTRHLMLEQNFLGMWLTMLNRLTAGRDVPYRYLKRDLRYPSRTGAVRDAAVTLLAGVPLLPLAVAAETLAGTVGRGGTIAVQAEAV